MKWAVVFIGDDDKEKFTAFNSDQCHFSMSVCVRWYSPDLNNTDIKRLRFYAARPVFYDANNQPLSNRFDCIGSFAVSLHTISLDFTLLKHVNMHVHSSYMYL